MKFSYLFAAIASGLCLCATSCIDNDYDLSDIDTTAQIKVDNLVIPLNIEPSKMSSVIDLESDDIITLTDANGKEYYAYVTDGSFDSDEANVSAINISGPKIDPNVVNVEVPEGVPTDFITETLSYEIESSQLSPFTLSANGISQYITYINKVDGTVTLTLSLKFDNIKEYATMVHLLNMKVQLPKYLIMASASNDGEYEPATGIFTLKSDIACPTDQPYELTLDFVGVTNTGNYFNYQKEADPSKCHQIKISDKVGLIKEEGTTSALTIEPADVISGKTLPKSFKLNLDYTISDIVVSSIDGKLQYEVDNINVPEVEINDLPDFLSEEGTNLMIYNPRLYLHVVNPLQKYDLYATTGLNIATFKDGAAVGSYSINNPISIGKAPNLHADGVYNYCLSPFEESINDLDAADKAIYTDIMWQQFSDLGKILSDPSGNGVPNKIQISLSDPSPIVPAQDVVNFKIPQTIDKVEGKYKFIAPLQLKGSKIIYTDTQDGWHDKDMDKLTITKFEANLKLTTNIPVGVKFEAWPIDIDGKDIKGVTVEPVIIPANANAAPVKIVVNGTIKGSELDGLRFKATATGDGDNALSPNMEIEIKDLRPCFGGYYTDKF